MSVINDLYQITQSLYQAVKNQIDKENRETQIDEITKLLNQRQELISQLNPPYTEGENKLGLEIVKLNKVIDHQLNKIFNDIKTDIKELKTKKEKSMKYANPYDSLSIDGMFFDKKN